MAFPNALTVFRIAAVPVVLVAWEHGAHLTALTILALAMGTDYADGRLARAWQQETLLGAVLDPVADKVLVIALYGYLYLRGALPGWLVAMTLLRNVSQLTAIPVLSWWLKIPFGVKPKAWPKWATATSFLIAWIGLASLDPAFPTSRPVPGNLWFLVLLLSGWMELTILVTFLPRFYQILARTHDTFE